MNDYGMARSPLPPGVSNSRLSPPGRTALDGYKKEMLSGFERDPPRLNPVRPPLCDELVSIAVLVTGLMAD